MLRTVKSRIVLVISVSILLILGGSYFYGGMEELIETFVGLSMLGGFMLTAFLLCNWILNGEE